MTEQPAKQRKRQRNAPLHERHGQVRATLSGDLREEHDQRNVRVNEGDTVEVFNRVATVTDVYSNSVWVIFADGSPRKTPVISEHVTPLEDSV